MKFLCSHRYSPAHRIFCFEFKGKACVTPEFLMVICLLLKKHPKLTMGKLLWPVSGMMSRLSASTNKTINSSYYQKIRTFPPLSLRQAIPSPLKAWPLGLFARKRYNHKTVRHPNLTRPQLSSPAKSVVQVAVDLHMLCARQHPEIHSTGCLQCHHAQAFRPTGLQELAQDQPSV